MEDKILKIILSEGEVLSEAPRLKKRDRKDIAKRLANQMQKAKNPQPQAQQPQAPQPQAPQQTQQQPQAQQQQAQPQQPSQQEQTVQQAYALVDAADDIFDKLEMGEASVTDDEIKDSYNKLKQAERLLRDPQVADYVKSAKMDISKKIPDLLSQLMTHIKARNAQNVQRQQQAQQDQSTVNKMQPSKPQMNKGGVALTQGTPTQPQQQQPQQYPQLQQPVSTPVQQTPVGQTLDNNASRQMVAQSQDKIATIFYGNKKLSNQQIAQLKHSLAANPSITMTKTKDDKNYEYYSVGGVQGMQLPLVLAFRKGAKGVIPTVTGAPRKAWNWVKNKVTSAPSLESQVVNDPVLEPILEDYGQLPNPPENQTPVFKQGSENQLKKPNRVVVRYDRKGMGSGGGNWWILSWDGWMQFIMAASSAEQWDLNEYSARSPERPMDIRDVFTIDDGPDVYYSVDSGTNVYNVTGWTADRFKKELKYIQALSFEGLSLVQAKPGK